MARSRNLKPGFFKNEDLAECTPEARLTFAGLWTLADREGRLEDRPKRIKAELFPFDSWDVEPLLQELAGRSFILRYQVDGRALIQVVNFAKHQNPHHREAPSDLPPPSPGLLPHGMPQKPEALPPSNGEARGPSRADSLFSDSLQSDSMTDAGASPAAMTEGDLWKAGAQLLGKAGMAESSARSFLGKLVKDHTSAIVMEAVGAAIVAQPADPAAYIRGACRKQPYERFGGHKAESFRAQDQRAAEIRAAELAPGVARKSHPGSLAGLDYRNGVSSDGTVTV